MFDLNFQLHSLVNPQKLFVRLWNKRYITCTWNKCQKHENTLPQYWHKSFYTLLYHKVLICSLAFAQKKTQTFVGKGKWLLHLFHNVSRSLYTVDPSDDPTPENCRKNISLSLLPFSSLYITHTGHGWKRPKVFLRRIACENLPLNKKSDRSENVKDISELIPGYGKIFEKVI